MSAMQLLLPDDVREFIDEQIKSGRYESPSAMIAALVEEARLRAAREKLDKLLEEGENSPLIDCTEEWLDQTHASLLARLPGDAST